jgi:hypothetical protein
VRRPEPVFRLGGPRLGFSLINQSLNWRNRRSHQELRRCSANQVPARSADRDGIAKSSPMGRSSAPGQAACTWLAVLRYRSTIYYPFSVDSSKALLAEVGFRNQCAMASCSGKWPAKGRRSGWWPRMPIGGTIAEALVTLFKQAVSRSTTASEEQR